MSDAKEEFWERLEDLQAGMLGLKGDGALVAMSPNLRDTQDGKIWFITARGTDLVSGVQDGPQDARFVIADSKTGLYADLVGQLELSTDKAVLDDVWSVVAAAWFEDNKQDDDVRLLCFTPKRAEASFSTTSAAKFLYEIAKANLSDGQPNSGWQASIVFQVKKAGRVLSRPAIWN